jgi:hypothetical protein
LVFTTNTNYGNVSVIIVKENCSFSTTSTTRKISPNGSITFTSSCSSPDPCAACNIRNLIGYTNSRNAQTGVVLASFNLSCSSPLTAEYKSGDNFISNLSIPSTSSSSRQIIGDLAVNNWKTLKEEVISIKLNGSECATVSTWQKGTCSDSNTPTLDVTNISHPYDDVTTYTSRFINDCWQITGVTVVSNPPDYSFVSASYINISGNGIVTINCNRGQKGYSAYVEVYVKRIDGTTSPPTGMLKINISWV